MRRTRKILKYLLSKEDRLCGLVVRVSGCSHRSQVRFPALPDFLSSGGSGTGSLSLVRIYEELLGRKVAAAF
jgi:hypothetical protein